MIKDEAWSVSGGTTLFSICLWSGGYCTLMLQQFMLRKYIQKTKTYSFIALILAHLLIYNLGCTTVCTKSVAKKYTTLVLKHYENRVILRTKIIP